jgi:hypothetical protein
MSGRKGREGEVRKWKKREREGAKRKKGKTSGSAREGRQRKERKEEGKGAKRNEGNCSGRKGTEGEGRKGKMSERERRGRN